MLLVMEHWLLTHFQHDEMSLVTSGNQFPGSLSQPGPANRDVPQLPLSHCDKQFISSGKMITRDEKKGHTCKAQNDFMEDQGSFSPGL